MKPILALTVVCIYGCAVNALAASSTASVSASSSINATSSFSASATSNGTASTIQPVILAPGGTAGGYQYRGFSQSPYNTFNRHGYAHGRGFNQNPNFYNRNRYSNFGSYPYPSRSFIGGTYRYSRYRHNFHH